MLPSEEDEPDANFFFEQGTWGGRFRMDFAGAIEIAQVNTYSWHPNTRGPQVYKVYGSDGSGANFDGAPKSDVDPVNCGWKLIASVDTRTQFGENGGQYGVSLSGAGGSLGKYRYLLFSIFQTEVELIESEDVLRRVVVECGLDHKKSLLGWFGWGQTNEQRTAKAVNRLKAELGVEPVKKSNVIGISYESQSPQLAYKVLTTLNQV